MAVLAWRRLRLGLACMRCDQKAQAGTGTRASLETQIARVNQERQGYQAMMRSRRMRQCWRRPRT